MLGKPAEELKLIIAHIGNGASMCAVKNGESIETTMGLTPLAGITMGTRCGDIDPSIPEFIAENTGMTIQEINTMFNKESGLLGISGLSNDRRDLEAAVDNPRAQMAVKRQNRQVANFIARYYIALGGCDCIIFTAGVGENSVNLREYVGNKLGVLGVEIDEEINNSRPKNQFINTENSSIKVAVISTNEELMMARDVINLSQ
jgi:acetate kinase